MWINKNMGIALRIVSFLSVFICFCSAADKGLNILVFGGNGFIGGTTVDRILQIHPDSHITIVNRHNWYWDSDKRIRPKVANIIHCDRMSSLTEYCPDLIKFLESERHFDIVIDFSAYSGKVIKDVTPYLMNKVGLYFLISTDSVYEACEKSHEEHTKEEDCTIPENEEQREAIYSKDDYAHRKRQAEDALVEQRLQDGGFNFIILRLPDVIGARDGTNRWWTYQLWAKLANEIEDKPIRFPTYLEKWPMSFVFVDDVADTIVGLFDAPPQVRDQVINLAWPETITLPELLNSIENVLGVENKHDIHEPFASQFYMYPSVRKGPISVEKAQSLLAWEPTPWTEAVKSIVKFYEVAMADPAFVTQRNEIIQVITSHIYNDTANRLYEALEKLYGIDLSHFKTHDEL